MASAGDQPLVTGTYVGTGSALSIDTVGFKPKYIRFVNATTGAEAEYSDTMAADSVRTSDSGVDAFATTGGVTLADTGFDLGTNAVVNTSANVVHWIAFA